MSHVQSKPDPPISPRSERERCSGPGCRSNQAWRRRPGSVTCSPTGGRPRCGICWRVRPSNRSPARRRRSGRPGSVARSTPPLPGPSTSRCLYPRQSCRPEFAAPPGGRSPTSRVQRGARTSRRPSTPSFVSFGWRYRFLFGGGNDEISQVPGEPSRTCPALRPRLDLTSRPLSTLGVAFRDFDGAGSNGSLFSGINHTACALAVYASQPGSPLDHARLATTWGPAFVGGP